MIGLDPVSLQLMRADFADLLSGPDAVPVTMQWETGVPNEIYLGTWVGEPTVHTQAFRAIIVFALGPGQMKGISTKLSQQRFAEMPDADIAMIMPLQIAQADGSVIDLNLKGLVGLKFTVTGLGEYRVVEKPSQDLSQYAVMFPNAEGMVQFVECKVVK